MKAALLEQGKMRVADIPEPQPGNGHVIVQPILCGVCGSDLHARDHADHLCDLLHRAGFRGFMDPDQPVVMGHEFCAEIVEHGPATGRSLPMGQRVVAMPFLTGADGVELIGYSNRFNGAFAERMLLDEAALIAVPDHVNSEVAALTEPLAVAVHAVAQSGGDGDCCFAVHGCGPVGLFVIARLRALGLGPILAIDPVAARREMAGRMGADIAIAPDREEQERWWRGQGMYLGLSDTVAAAATGAGKRAVAFECVGKPGMLRGIAEDSPVGSTITVVGTCMETDMLEPALMIQKAIQLRFVFAYSADEFAEAFAMIAADPSRLRPLVTGQVGLGDVDDAFSALIAGGDQVKMLVRPN
ncbi:MAG: alcohol dehydrogenase catalytic domain-containing protein [Sphingomonadales bacterium]|nr:alcohol dehydrogenase catalytic domain-containing protein [Sphingomonadales bacterium]